VLSNRSIFSALNYCAPHIIPGRCCGTGTLWMRVSILTKLMLREFPSLINLAKPSSPRPGGSDSKACSPVRAAASPVSSSPLGFTVDYSVPAKHILSRRQDPPGLLPERLGDAPSSNSSAWNAGSKDIAHVITNATPAINRLRNAVMTSRHLRLSLRHQTVRALPTWFNSASHIFLCYWRCITSRTSSSVFSLERFSVFHLLVGYGDNDPVSRYDSIWQV
jgi:hypothetical protein